MKAPPLLCPQIDERLMRSSLPLLREDPWHFPRRVRSRLKVDHPHPRPICLGTEH